MAIQKPEWFPMDPAKFFSDSVVDSMTTTELGATLRLLGRQWLDGSIPDDLHLLSRLCRLTEAEMVESWKVLQKFFPVLGPGKRANRWLFVKREAVIAELDRKSDHFTQLARTKWEVARNATRNATRSADSNADGSADSNADGSAERSADGMPHAMPAAIQEKSREEQRRPEQRGIPPAMRDAMRTASGEGSPPGSVPEEKAPEGLNRLQYAAGLLEKLGHVASNAALSVVAESIRLLAKDEQLNLAGATDLMELRARAAETDGARLDRFWFEDGKWRVASKGPHSEKGGKLEQRLRQQLAESGRD